MSYNVNRINILNYKTNIYVAKRLGYSQDENLNQIENYAKPIRYRFNVQPLSEDSEIREFGELANKMKVIIITPKEKYLNKFCEFDKAYVDSIPTGEARNGANADYRIYSVRNQNACIRVYLQKIVK